MTVRKRPVGLFPNVSMFKDAASRVLRCDKLRPVDPDIHVLQALLGYERPAIVVNAGSVALVSWFAADRANGTAHPNLLHGKNPLPVVCFAKALLRAVLAAARLARGTLELVAATKAYTHVFSSLLIDVSTESALGGAVEAATMLTGMKGVATRETQTFHGQHATIIATRWQASCRRQWWPKILRAVGE